MGRVRTRHSPCLAHIPLFWFVSINFRPLPPPPPSPCASVRSSTPAVSGTGAQGFGEEVVSAMKALDGPALLMACAARHHIHMGIVTSALHMADFMSLDSALRVRPTAEALTCARHNVCVDRAVISGHDRDDMSKKDTCSPVPSQSRGVVFCVCM